MCIRDSRNTVYKKQFPTGTWLEVKGLAVPGQLIEIDMEAHKACLLYTSDAADDLLCVDLGGRRIIKKKKKTIIYTQQYTRS